MVILGHEVKIKSIKFQYLGDLLHFILHFMFFEQISGENTKTD